MRTRIVALKGLLLSVVGIFSGLQAEEEGIRILGIGNSFTENATQYLPAIIGADPDLEADVAVAGIGGSPLDLHVRLAEAHETDPRSGRRYKYLYNTELRGEGLPLKSILSSEKWDYITIQQVSHKSYKPETFVPYARQLVEYVRSYAPDAEILLHETWAHNIDSYRFKEWGLHPDEMYARLHEAYADKGKELDLRVVPVGTAFHRVKEEPLWDYRPTDVDTDQFVYPADRDNLPDASRSLHTIFYWHFDEETDRWKLVNDGFHANRNGKFLAGLVWYAFFFDRDPRENDFAPPGMEENREISLKETAFEVVESEASSEENPG